MAVYPNKNTSPQQGSNKLLLPAAILAGILLIALIGWLYQKNFGPPPTPPPSASEKANHDYIIGVYDRAGGDWSKVADEDKQKLDHMTGGYGQVAFTNSKK